MGRKNIAERLRGIADQIEESGLLPDDDFDEIAQEYDDVVVGYRKYSGDRASHIDVVFPNDALGVRQIPIGSELADRGYYIQSIARDPTTPHGDVPPEKKPYRLFVSEWT